MRIPDAPVPTPLWAYAVHKTNKSKFYYQYTTTQNHSFLKCKLPSKNNPSPLSRWQAHRKCLLPKNNIKPTNLFWWIQDHNGAIRLVWHDTDMDWKLFVISDFNHECITGAIHRSVKPPMTRGCYQLNPVGLEGWNCIRGASCNKQITNVSKSCLTVASEMYTTTQCQ